MKELKLTRLLLSSYYIAAIFSFKLFDLIVNSLETWLQWMVSTYTSVTGSILDNGGVWFCLFIICFSITFVIRRFVVEPLDFYVNGNAKNSYELGGLAILILGYYIYSLNLMFPQYSMPDFLPDFVKTFLGDIDVNNTVIDRSAWSIVPWIWNLGPIVWIYAMFLKTKGGGGAPSDG